MDARDIDRVYGALEAFGWIGQGFILGWPGFARQYLLRGGGPSGFLVPDIFWHMSFNARGVRPSAVELAAPRSKKPKRY
jgi:hypothetical protein